MNIFEQYGIKEVADVTLYSIHKKEDGSGDIYYVPALHLDTLKISSTEKTAETTWAEGGYGNARLVSWDHSKQINVTLEDALCTPASLSLCWGGVLGADWKNGKVNIKDATQDEELNRISRFEKCFYPNPNRNKSIIGNLLPKTENDFNGDLSLLHQSSIVDGLSIDGHGNVKNKSYYWKMIIESAVKSIVIMPNKFFDVTGKSYNIDQNIKVSVSDFPADSIYRYMLIYKVNSSTVAEDNKAKIIFNNSNNDISSYNATIDNVEDVYDVNIGTGKLKDMCLKSNFSSDAIKPEEAEHLAIIVDNNENYQTFLRKDETWYQSSIPILTEQFKNIDMWIHFNSLNEMIYFILTKYQDNIYEINSATIDADENNTVDEGTTTVTKNKTNTNSLWCYVNPSTMLPYDDEYWLHQGEVFYKKSLTIAKNNKKLKGKKITVKAGQFPGMYMFVGETFIKNRDTGENENLQIRIPLCKVKSEHTFTLEADGEPTVFNLDLEVAKTKNDTLIEIIPYETEGTTVENDIGELVKLDGSNSVKSE